MGGYTRAAATAITVAAALTITGCSAPAESGCLEVSDELMQTIAEGANMTPIEPVAAAAVKTDPIADGIHPDGSYLLALEFSSADIADGGTKTGVWAVASLDTADAPPILAVNPLADLFTDWPSEVRGVRLTGDEDGVDEATACLAASEGGS